MLSFAMITRNEGRSLDATLNALAKALRQGDHLIAIDTGSTDDTPARLRAFGEGAGCTVIVLDVASLSCGEALALALDHAPSPYLMLLGPGDRLQLTGLVELRKTLEAQRPDLVIVNDGWWTGNPARAGARTDADRIAALPRDAGAADLIGLCPDPRRCVLARDIWLARRETLTAPATYIALYAALIAHHGKTALIPAQTVLRPYEVADPAPLLAALTAHVMAQPRAARQDALHHVMIWADEAVACTAPGAADGLIALLEEFLRALPRRLHSQLRSHDGPAGALFAAHKSDGRQGALLRFALGALAAQQHRNDILAAELSRLQRDVDAALPGPAYLRDLYDRVRDL